MHSEKVSGSIHMSQLTDSIPQRWQELNGQNKWKGLLDPLDNDLRRILIHYGEMAQATYDAFNKERASKYAGSSRYARKNLFARVGLTNAKPLMKYDVVKYFYATSQIGIPDCFIIKSYSKEAWCKECNWMGYIAVATDEGKTVLGRREIVIVWRGTIQESDWFKNFEAPLVTASAVFGGDKNPRLHLGWLSMYTSTDSHSTFCGTSAREQVLSEVRRLINQYKDEEVSISVTGHSLGASLATINAADIVANNINVSQDEPKRPRSLVTAIAFACPPVGDSNFQHMVEDMESLSLLRVCNAHDIVPALPIPGYRRVGELLLIDCFQSEFLKVPGNIRTWHILEVYLHTLAGTQGSKEGFKLELDRDIALVNKACDALRNEYMVPPHWWSPHNKGMIQMGDGHWKLDDHEEDI